MKHVVFKTLKIKNFFSIGNTPVEIDFDPGLHVISGINKDKLDRKNGVGKSTIADAFFFAIFGKTTREIAKKELISNNLTDGTCEVVLDFEVHSPSESSNYRIVRRLRPSQLYFEKDGADITRDSISNTSSYISEILGASDEIFKNCVVMTANNTVPFMGQKNTSKRKFIEDIFKLGAFGEMLKLARSEYNDVKKDYDLDLLRYEEKNTAIINYKRQQQSIIDGRAEKINTYKERYKNNKKIVKELIARLSKIDSIDTKPSEDKLREIVDGIESVEKKIREQIHVCAELKTDIKRDSEEYDKMGTSKDKCPTCLKEITSGDRESIDKQKEHAHKHINDKKDELRRCSEKIDKLHDVKDKLVALKTKAQSKLDGLKQEKNYRQSTVDSINQYNGWIASLEEDLAALKCVTTDVDDLIVLSEAEINDIIKLIEKKKSILNIIDVGKFIVSEEGVKAYIVKQILQLFNSRLAYYLKKMDANCVCIFNEYFEEEIINDSNKICSYFNFSDGERKNIDLACLFTFADARKLQGNVTYNVSFFDELYDSSLDSRGVELANNILLERVGKNNECIFIITHRPEAIKAITDKADIILLQKENGITTRVPNIDD